MAWQMLLMQRLFTLVNWSGNCGSPSDLCVLKISAGGGLVGGLGGRSSTIQIAAASARAER